VLELCFERGIKMENFMELHERGIAIVGRYKMSETEVLGVLQEQDKTKLYLKFNCKSLFEYSRKFHKMSEPVTLNFIAVSRRATQVPELKAAIETGELTVSAARKITSVITPSSQSDWISKAINLTSRGSLENVTVPAGTFQACEVTSQNQQQGTTWIGNVVFGAIKQSFTDLQGAKYLRVLKSELQGN
jgi:hypothetical protein